MFLELGFGFFAYWQRLRLLAASLRLLVADVLYTWTAAKPDQAETEMVSGELFFVLLSPTDFKNSSLVWNGGKFEWGKCEPRDACT